jgi:hypothetical protein
MEVPASLEFAARAAGIELAVALPPEVNGGGDQNVTIRPLHAKQISVRQGGSWQSYLGSANATAQGLALGGRPNIELGVVVDTKPLLPRVEATGTRAPPALDPDDPSDLLDDSARWADLYGRAFLEADGTLRIHVEPAPAAQSELQMPIGGSTRQLAHRVDQHLQLTDEEMSSLIHRPELIVVTSTGRLAVPVVLDNFLKLQVGTSQKASSDLDALLAELSRNPTRRPSDDETDAPDPHERKPAGNGPPPPASPRKPVHRAREAIEVITAAEQPLRDFLNAKPPPRLVELRIGGAGSIVDLARRVASTSATDKGLTVVAAAFVVKEVVGLIGRLAKTNPAAKTVLALSLKTQTSADEASFWMRS